MDISKNPIKAKWLMLNLSGFRVSQKPQYEQRIKVILRTFMETNEKHKRVQILLSGEVINIQENN